MNYSRKQVMQDEILSNLMEAHKKMASDEKADVKTLIRLSRYLLYLLNKLDDKIIQLSAEEKK